jgi:hypothetical protein
VLRQHVASGQQALVDAGDAAEAEAQALRVRDPRHALDGAVGQGLEHEAPSQREMQVVESDIDLLQARRAGPRLNASERGGRLQQRNDGRATGHDLGEGEQLLRRGEHGQHQAVGTFGQHRVHFGAGAFVQRIHADHQGRALQHGADPADVAQLVGTDERVQSGLALLLAHALEVDEQAKAAQGLAALGKRRIVRDLDQLEHACSHYRRSAPRRSALAHHVMAMVSAAAATAASHCSACRSGRPTTSSPACSNDKMPPALTRARQGNH